MKTEFGVYTIQPLGLQLARVGIRVHCGIIHLGDVFTALVSPPRRHVATENSDDACTQVVLEVTRIETFRRPSDQLDPGATAWLMVRGQGAAHLVEGSRLQLESSVP